MRQPSESQEQSTNRSIDSVVATENFDQEGMYGLLKNVDYTCPNNECDTEPFYEQTQQPSYTPKYIQTASIVR